MKLGKINLLLIIISFFFNLNAASEEKIISTPLINLDKLKPSYEELENEDSNKEKNEIIKLKERKKNLTDNNTKWVNLLGLDKITAKTTKIKIKLGETKKFGLLEIKALKCGVSVENNTKGNVAYIQVKDLSDNQNEKVFVFNGWTFSSNPSLAPIDHPVYDLWLIDCENV